MPAIPGYSDVGKAVADLFKGSAKSGAFQLDNKITYSGVTSSGLSVTLTGVSKGGKVDPLLKASYAQGAYSADVTYDGSSRLAVNAAVANLLLPGLKLSGIVALPDPNSARASIDYAFPYLSTKASVSLTNKPVVDLLASTGYKDIIVGVETGFDTAKSAVNKYNIAVGYHAPDFQLAVNILDQLNTVKVGYVQNVNSTTKVGTEVLRKLNTGDTTISLGYAKALPSGALAKFKVDNSGFLSVLYETRLASGEKISGAVQLQATDLSKPIKMGFAIDLA